MCLPVCLPVVFLATLPDPQSAEAMGWVGATIAAICVALNQVVSFWFKLFPRKSPPDHETYATKQEVAALELEHEHEMERIEKRFSEWMTQQERNHHEAMREWRGWHSTLSGWQLQIERALGHTETKADEGLRQSGQDKRRK